MFDPIEKIAMEMRLAKKLAKKAKKDKCRKDKKSKKEKKAKKEKKEKKVKKEKSKKERKEESLSATEMMPPPPPPPPLLKQQPQEPQQPSNNLIGPTIPEEFRQKLDLQLIDTQIKELEAKESEENPGREKWMLELPDAFSGILAPGARKFRKRDGPDFSKRSQWTEVPHTSANYLAKRSEYSEELERLRAEKRRLEAEAIERRNEEQRTLVDVYNDDHDIGKSLLQIHQENRKKIKMAKSSSCDGTDETSGRRPFDRNVDLKVTKIDASKRNALLRRAQCLDSNFHSGKSQFL